MNYLLRHVTDVSQVQRRFYQLRLEIRFLSGPSLHYNQRLVTIFLLRFRYPHRRIQLVLESYSRKGRKERLDTAL